MTLYCSMPLTGHDGGVDGYGFADKMGPPCGPEAVHNCNKETRELIMRVFKAHKHRKFHVKEMIWTRVELPESHHLLPHPVQVCFRRTMAAWLREVTR